MVYFADKKYTSGFSCYCIVVDDVNKQIGFHGNAPPSRKQRPLIRTALTLFQPTRCRIFHITRQSWYRSNTLHTQNSELKRLHSGVRGWFIIVSQYLPRYSTTMLSRAHALMKSAI